MTEVNLKETVKKLYEILPIITRKFLRPVEQHTKIKISPMQFNSMIVINNYKPVTMKKIAEELNISKQQTTLIIDKLIEINYVRRENDAYDRRIVRIALTESGIRFLENERRILSEILKEKIECLDDSDLYSLNMALGYMLKTINKLP